MLKQFSIPEPNKPEIKPEENIPKISNKQTYPIVSNLSYVNISITEPEKGELEIETFEGDKLKESLDNSLVVKGDD